MSALTDALEVLGLYSVNPLFTPEEARAMAVIRAAARRVAEAPEIEWCEAHGHSIANYWEKRCEAASNDEPCRMVRKLLVDP